MSNFSFTKNQSYGLQSQVSSQNELQNILFGLKQLKQVQDESRNQQCPAYLDEQSFNKSRPSSPWQAAQYPTQINILQQLQQATPHALNQSRSSRNHALKNQHQLVIQTDLKNTNKKLQEDNIKLFSECMRLRKLCKHQEMKIEEIKSQNNKTVNNLIHQSRQFQEQNKSLWNEIQQFRLQSRRMQEKIRQSTLELTSYQILSKKHEKVCFQMRQMEEQNQQLCLKVVKLQQQLQLLNSRNSSKSSQSYNNSTQESRQTETHLSRKITNMKIVHESQLRKLRQIIQDLNLKLKNQIPFDSN